MYTHPVRGFFFHVQFFCVDYLLINEFVYYFESFYRNSGSNHHHDHRAVFKSIQRWEFHFNFRKHKTHTKKKSFYFNYLSSLQYQNIIILNLFIRSLQVKDRIENLTRKFWEIMEWKSGEMEVCCRDGFFCAFY